jgi:integrase
MIAYNPKNERIKREFFRHQKETGGKADSTLDGIRKAIGRFEAYTGHKDLATFNREQAIGFKRHLARTRSARTGEPMAKSTLIATAGALKEFFRWLSWQPGYKSKIRVTNVDYLNMSENDTRAAKAPRFKTAPTIEQVRAALAAMPAETEIDRRNRALIALAILTGARDRALATLRLKHIDLERKLVLQDPREVMTKRRKRIDTYFFPLGEDLEAIVVDWVRYLREVKLYGNEDPVFPRTSVRPGGNGSFVVDGVEPVFWENTQPIRRIFREAFAAAGLPYFNPHSLRDTLVIHFERLCPTIEHLKAVSQNLGHEHLATTVSAYGNMAPHRQGELVREVSGDSGTNPGIDRHLFQELRRIVDREQRRRRDDVSDAQEI